MPIPLTIYGGAVIVFFLLSAALVLAGTLFKKPVVPTTTMPLSTAETVKTVVDQRVTSYSQSGGQTAHTIHNREPDPIPQRRLTSNQEKAIAGTLKEGGVIGTILEVQFASREHATFSAQIASVFEHSGWKRETLCIPSREAPHEMAVGFLGSRSEAYLLAIKALNLAGLRFSEGEYEGPTADISLDVGILQMTAFQRAADRWPE